MYSESFQHEEPTVMSRDDLKSTSRTNWAALESRSEENIDYSDIPPLTDDFFERATLSRISHIKYDHEPQKPYRIWVLTGCLPWSKNDSVLLGFNLKSSSIRH